MSTMKWMYLGERQRLICWCHNWLVSCLSGVAMTNLEHVDMHSSRNQVVLGSSVLLGLMVPLYLKSTPGAIKTGETIIFPNTDFCFVFALKQSFCWRNNVINEDLYSGGSKGGAPLRPKIFSLSFSFWRIGVPSYRESRIRPCYIISFK